MRLYGKTLTCLRLLGKNEAAWDRAEGGNCNYHGRRFGFEEGVEDWKYLGKELALRAAKNIYMRRGTG